MIEKLITQIVQAAPARDPQVFQALHHELEQIGTPLAIAIAQILELVAEDLVDPGIALPALAGACATLAAGQRGELDDRVLEAARYQIDTLQPVPDRPVVAAPDVPITSLRRR